MEELDRKNNESYHDYDVRLRRARDPNKNKVFTSSYTTKDIFRYIQKNRKKLGVTYEVFSKIVKAINQSIAEEVLKGRLIRLPAGMGSLYMGKKTIKIKKLSTGKYITTSLVNWKATKDLWYIDEEAEKMRAVIYFNNVNDEVFRMCYSRNGCSVKNLMYFKFRPHRRVKLSMQDINKNDIIFKYD